METVHAASSVRRTKTAANLPHPMHSQALSGPKRRVRPLIGALRSRGRSWQSAVVGLLGWLARTLVLVYGTVVYSVLLLTFVYAVGFIGRFIVPKAVNSGGAVPPLYAVVIDLMLLGLCAIQHSGKARKAILRALTRHLPPVIGRSTYVLCCSLVLIALFVFWQPIHAVVWHVDNLAIAFLMQLLAMIGWLMVLYGTFLVGHFELFGLKQVALNFVGRAAPAASFKTPGIDRVIRNQICLGLTIAFWATPKMTAGHLLLAAATTAYIFVCLALEERNRRSIDSVEADRGCCRQTATPGTSFA